MIYYISYPEIYNNHIKYQMSSFRDKINNKLSINSKPVQTKLTSYDETYIKITVVGGQTQLCPIKLNCQWNPNANTIIQNKQPQLICKWFNKTENSMNVIDNVIGSYYQPSINDVGTVIHVQCEPQLEGVQYQGMPIIKQIGPIKIDPETQQQANDLLTAKKATFSIKIKNSDLVETPHGEGLIKIQKLNFRMLKKTQDLQQELINLQITDEFPIAKCVPGKNRQIEIVYQSDRKVVAELTNNKVRDVLILLLKLILASKEQFQGTNINKGIDAKEQIAILPIIEHDSTSKQKNQQPQVTNQSLTTNSQTVKSEVFEDPIKYEAGKESEVKKQERQRQESLKQSNPQSQASEQEIKEANIQKGSHKNVSEIKSSEDLSFASPVIKKGGSKIQQISPPMSGGKQNSLELLQIADLKKQLRANEGEIFQLKKTIGERNESIEGLKQQINRMRQREGSLSCNYFQLQDQMKKIKQNCEKSSQQVSYYKNENRIIKAQNEKLQKQSRMQSQQIMQLEEKLQPFMNIDARQERSQSYSQIRQNYQKLLVIREQLEVKYSYMKEEAEKVQQKYEELKESVEQIESERNFYKKKYENVTQEMQSSASSPVSSSKLIYSSRISMDSNSNQEPKRQQNREQFDKYEKQILDLKKKLKGLVEQNNFLREVKAASTKEKKSSSKSHLKVELGEMKKIVNRLSQEVIEKDLALQNTRRINKEMNEKLLHATKLIDSYQKKLMDEQQMPRHAQSFN